MAERLDIDDRSCLKLYPDRLQTQHEHAREIRELLRYKEFAERELNLRSYVASRVWNSVESRRALSDRAVIWMLRERVLLPGISVLSRLVTEVRAGKYERIHGLPTRRVGGEAGCTRWMSPVLVSAVPELVRWR